MSFRIFSRDVGTGAIVSDASWSVSTRSEAEDLVRSLSVTETGKEYFVARVVARAVVAVQVSFQELGG